MHMRDTGPAIPKETTSETDQTGWDAQGKACLRDGNAGFDGIPFCRALMVCILGQTGKESNRLTNKQGDLNKSAGGIAEVVGGGIDLCYTLSHEEYEAKTKSGPESKEEDDGLGEE